MVFYKSMEFKIYITLFVLTISVFFVYYMSTRFENKYIIVDDNKLLKSSGKKSHNLISDTDGNIYKVSNSWMIFHFNSSEVLNSLKPGKAFMISGYGVRIPTLGMYPLIISATLK